MSIMSKHSGLRGATSHKPTSQIHFNSCQQGHGCACSREICRTRQRSRHLTLHDAYDTQLVQAVEELI